MRFKVGDRVRIACPVSNLDGKVGTVWAIRRAPHQGWSGDAKAAGVRRYHTGYLVDVDGIGRFCAGGSLVIAFPHFYLRPAVDPRAEQFIADMKRFASVMKARVYPIPSDQLKHVSGGSQ